MLFTVGQRSSMDHIYHARRIENVNHLEVPTIICAPPNTKLLIGFSPRKAPCRMPDDKLRLRPLDAMLADMLQIPGVPAEFIHFTD